MLKNLIKTIGLTSSSLLIVNSSVVLSEHSIKYQSNPLFLQSSNWSKGTILKKAEEVNGHLEKEKENTMLQSTKQYTYGLDKVESSGILKVWLTKAYLGNIATILGATAATAGAILGVAILVLSLKIATTAATLNPILGLVMVIIGALFAIATAFIMNKINGYNFGGFFKVDFSVAASPITAMSTLREQDKYETAPRLIPLDERIKFGNDDSFNFIKDDKSQGKTESYWSIKDSKKFYGVIDISEYTKYAKEFKVNGVKANIAFYNESDQEFSIRNNNIINQFLLEYFLNKTNHYLFFVFEELNNGAYKLKIGGSQNIDKHNESHEWISRIFKNVQKVTDLSVQLLTNLRS